MGGFRANVLWRSQFVTRFNGKAKMLGSFTITKAMYSHASNWGLGATFVDDWVVATFDQEQALGDAIGHHSEPVPVGSISTLSR